MKRRTVSGFLAVTLLVMPTLLVASTLATADLSVDNAPGGAFRLAGLNRGAAAPTWLALRPAQPFSPDARLIVVGPEGERELPMPTVRHFIGSERGDDASQAFVSVAADGSIRGWLQRGDAIEAFSRAAEDRSGAPLELARVDMADPALPARNFSCGTDELSTVPALAEAADEVADQRNGTAPQGGNVLLARVAIDTDHLYLDRFSGNVTNAARYAADLIGFASLTYRAQTGFGMTVSYLRLWEGGTSPWQQTSSSCLLYEFGKHWNDNMSGVQRTIAHFLSGRSGIGGIAWVGVLCRSSFQTNVTSANCPGLTGEQNVGGDYGFTGSIAGNFNPAAPQVVWDLMATAHEIGHNFNSPHTHCYLNLPSTGLAPIDQCATQSGTYCYSGGPTSLPGPQGQGSGTIMSYCHQQPGGMSNITFTLGSGHPFGILPGRVPDRMAAHAQTVSSNLPSCFAVDDTLFANGFQ